MTDRKSWTCPSCNNRRTSAYCPKCGEEQLRPHDLTARDLFGLFLKQFSNIDGRLIRSFRLLLTRPGALTVAHVKGQRRAYLAPISLFLIANALFFALQSVTHTSILSSPLQSHLYHQDWSALARDLVSHRLAARHMTLAAYAPLFDQAAVLHAKALIILMALTFTPALMALFVDSHRPIGAHVVFSLHLYTFILLLFCVSLILAEGQMMLLGGEGLASSGVDLALSLFNVSACAIYIYLGTAVAYGSSGILRISKSTLLTIVVASLVLGYRFAIFVITLYTT